MLFVQTDLNRIHAVAVEDSFYFDLSFADNGGDTELRVLLGSR